MFRRYRISIEIEKDGPQIGDDVVCAFGCSVSEPSNWLAPGVTSERGLTFLDGNGRELNSFIFRNQPYFNVMEEKTLPEEKEIEELIYGLLHEHYPIDAADVKIIVSEYNRL